MNPAIGGYRLNARAELHAQLVISNKALEKREELLAGNDWWKEELNTHDSPVVSAVEDQMGRIMANLDNACNGEQIALNAITAALHQIQKVARHEAMPEATELAEKEYELEAS